MLKILKVLLAFVIILFITHTETPIHNFLIKTINATVTVTTATGGSAISADTTGSTFTTITGPTITEGANGDFPATGTIVLTPPTGFVFNTTTITANITRVAGSKACFTTTATSATATSNSITFTLNAKDGTGGAPATTCKVVFSGIQVRPSSGTPLASGNLTDQGTANIIGLTSTTNLGTFTEVAGIKNKLTITQQPVSSTTINTNFSTLPIVALQDQFGNTETGDSTSTITRAVVLSSQACGGTSGTGSLTSTPISGATFTNGVITYTTMQYSVAENIKICFTSTGVTSVLSNAITVTTTPTVTTQATSGIKDVTAIANGNLTNAGNTTNDKEGFVYDTSTHSLPANVAPGASGYASFTENTGSFSTGAFTVNLSGLNGGTTYFGRAYSHNSAGYSYGGEVTFTTAVISISLTSSGTVSYGIVPVGGTKDTTVSGLNNTQSVQNSSSIAEDFNIKTTDATGGTTWLLGSSAGNNTYVHEFSLNSGGLWTKFITADSYQTLASNIGSGSSQNFDLRITVPTISSDFVQKSITLTIQAVAH